MKSGPIVVLEDDQDDRKVFEDILSELRIDNEVRWFTHGLEAFDYLKNTSEQPFIIVSDINLPGINGIEFKRRIDNDPQLRKKSIPFVFYSTAVSKSTINEAYTELTVQGYFQKSSKYAEIKKNIQTIIDYWKTCKHPNTV